MKIKVEYNEFEQTENLCGNFVFVRDGNKIRNLEAIADRKVKIGVGV